MGLVSIFVDAIERHEFPMMIRGMSNGIGNHHPMVMTHADVENEIIDNMPATSPTAHVTEHFDIGENDSMHNDNTTSSSTRSRSLRDHQIDRA
jgi:uncharacterized protein (UPF0276 family)